MINPTPLLFILLFLPSIHPLRVATIVSLPPRSEMILDSFQFYSGGKISIDLSNSQPSIQTWLCKKHDYSFVPNFKCLCQSYCNDFILIETNQSHFEMNTQNDVYYLVLVHCDYEVTKPAVTLNVNYTFLNPGGQELAAGDELLPWFYLILTILWIIMLFYVVFQTIAGRRYLTPIHFLVLLSVIIRIFFVTSVLIYWFRFKNSGRRMDLWIIFSRIFYSVSEGVYIFTIFVFATGWRVIRSGIKKRKLKLAVKFFAVGVLILLCFTFQNYYYLPILFVYLVSIPYIYFDLAASLKWVERQKELFISIDRDSPYIRMLENKEMVLYRFKLASIAYVICLVIVNFIKVVVINSIHLGDIQHPSEFVLFFYIFAVILIIKPKENNGFIYSLVDIIPFYNLEERIIHQQKDLVELNMNKTILINWPSLRGRKLSIGIEKDA